MLTPPAPLRITLLCSLVALFFGGIAMAKAKAWLFPYKGYAKVKAYTFNLAEDGKQKHICGAPFDGDGEPCPTLSEGVLMTSAQVEELLAAVNSRKTYGAPLSKCFIPHHGFVFYDKDEKLVAQISVCFMCDQLRGSPEVKAAPKRPMKAALSQGGEARLKAVCKDIGLKACDKSRP